VGHVSEDDLVDLVGVDAVAGEQLDDRDSAQLSGGNGGERRAGLGERRPEPIRENDVSHLVALCLVASMKSK
jgi:hypothetical protein